MEEHLIELTVGERIQLGHYSVTVLKVENGEIVVEVFDTENETDADIFTLYDSSEEDC